MRGLRAAAAQRFVWPVGVVSILLFIVSLSISFADRHATLPVAASSYEWNGPNALFALVNIVVPAIGILLASRRPENPIGWLFLMAGFMQALSTFAGTYAAHALVVDPGTLPGGFALAWLADWLQAVPLGILAFIFLLFPTGRLPSPRWQPAAWFMVVCITLLTGMTILSATQSWSDPYRASQGGPPGPVLLFTIVGPALISLAAVVVRFRRSSGDERLQLKWFVSTVALVVVGLALVNFNCGSFITCNPPAIFEIVFGLSLVLLWTAIAVAVLKYRLYEIDVVINRAVVYGTLAVFITLIYVGLVVGVGTVVGHRGSPLLSAIAAAVIAVAFQPIRERGRRLANRLVYGSRATPYEVLGAFSERVGETMAMEDVLPRMAQTLAEATAAVRADIWLKVGDELRDEASWPAGSDRLESVRASGEDVSAIGADLAVPVRHRGDLLGAISISKRPGEPVSATESKLAADLASQAGLVLRNARLTEELLSRLDELRASRQRIVAAQDEERRRLERNIHDGAQQQLVAIAVKAKLADAMVGRDETKQHELLNQLQSEAQEAMENLRDLARGIYPPLLADEGLVAALTAQARKSPVPVTVSADGIGRFSQDTEAAVYFCTLEALQNVAKYARANAATVQLAQSDGHLDFEIIDDGVGFDQTTRSYGTGTQGMADRLAALGGELVVTSSPGAGTRVRGRIPVTDPTSGPVGVPR